jgi:hypothetical protein
MSEEDIRSSLLALRALTTIKTIGELSNVDELRQLWNAKEQPSCVVKTTFGSSLGGYSATTDCCRLGLCCWIFCFTTSNWNSPIDPVENQAAEDHSTPDNSALSEVSSSERRL